MADIVAADVTARRIRIAKWGPDGSHPSGKIPIEVTMGVTIDPGTTDAYPLLGIPMTTLFSGSTPGATPAAGDSGLDFTQLLVYPGPVAIRAAAATFAPQFFASMHNSAATAAGQLLKLWRPTGKLVAVATATGSTIDAAASGNAITDSGNGLVTAGFEVGMFVVISGFTGTAGNNQTGVLNAVAAGTMGVTTAVAFVNDASSVAPLVTGYKSANGVEEFPNLDVTGVGLFNGDTDPYFEITMRGFLRENLRPSDFGILGA